MTTLTPNLTKLLCHGANELLPAEMHEIAKELLNNHCIVSRGVEYRIVEIEFYYHYKQGVSDEVYARSDKRPGQFFFHLSGFDICFECAKDYSYYGGILVRCIENTQTGEFYGGPMIAKNELLNNATDGDMPYLKAAENAPNFQTADPVRRINIKCSTDLKKYYRLVPEGESKFKRKVWSVRKNAFVMSQAYDWAAAGE